MASVTRSNRRPEGLYDHRHPSSHYHRHAHVTNGAGGGGGGGGGGGAPPLTRSTPALLHRTAGNHTSGRRAKRTFDGSDRADYEILKPKKARIAVEILARPSIDREDHVSPPQKPRARPGGAVASRAPTQPPPPKSTTTQQQHRSAATKPMPPQKKTENDTDITKHQAKVSNGIKHELDRLQPPLEEPTTNKPQGRKLRSQEATRFKSELSAYFPEYDEVIGNDPKEQHTLNADTPIVVVDSNAKRGTAPGPPRATIGASSQLLQTDLSSHAVRGYGDALFTDVFDSQRIDFGFLEVQYRNATLEDPLPDSLFEPVHKRAERLERSIRNSEKGRAQHEKDQIIRLLEGLQGHDWLRVMGVSGITESKKKGFEPARDHFIRGCKTILDKFRNWSLEEKRRKLERERALAEREEEGGDDGSAEDDNKLQEDELDDDDYDDEDDIGSRVEEASQAATSDASSPAKQLQEEALARSKLQASKGLKKPQPATRLAPPKQPEPPKPFTSFFKKKHERDSALNRSRRTGRKVLAWGHAIPELSEAEFVLPQVYCDDDTMRSRARKKRRDKRNKK